MSGRQHSPTERAARGALVTGAGMASLATLLAFAPLAHAAPTPAVDVATPGGTTDDSTPPTAPDQKADIAPIYGKQKFRVGVRGKAGNYFPDGTSTATTEFEVTETAEDGTSTSFPCTSEANTPDDVMDATFCPGIPFVGELDRRAASVNEPTPGQPFRYYIAAPGTRVTVIQTTVKANLVKDTSTATLEPCEVEEEGDGYCSQPVPGSESTRNKSTDLIFVDPGIPPVAVNDTAKTKEGVAVTIAIAPNDTAKAPIKSVEIVADPKDGTAKLVTAETADPAPSSSTPAGDALVKRTAGSRTLAAVTSYKAIYTPEPGFTGVDTFDYAIATANGAATAKVTVTVTGEAASGSASASASASAAASSDADDLADTGTQSNDLVGYGAALLAAGAGALALGQQRRRGRHAR